MKGIDWRASPLPGPTPVQSCVLRVLAVDVLSCGALRGPGSTTVVRDSSEPARAAGCRGCCRGMCGVTGFYSQFSAMTPWSSQPWHLDCAHARLSWAGGWSGVAGMAPAVWRDQQVHVERRADLRVLFLALCVLLPLAVSARPP